MKNCFKYWLKLIRYNPLQISNILEQRRLLNTYKDWFFASLSKNTWQDKDSYEYNVFTQHWSKTTPWFQYHYQEKVVKPNLRKQKIKDGQKLYELKVKAQNFINREMRKDENDFVGIWDYRRSKEEIKQLQQKEQEKLNKLLNVIIGVWPELAELPPSKFCSSVVTYGGEIPEVTKPKEPKPRDPFDKRF